MFQRASLVGLVARGEPGSWGTHKVLPVFLGNDKSAALIFFIHELLPELHDDADGTIGYQVVCRRYIEARLLNADCTADTEGIDFVIGIFIVTHLGLAERAR